MSQPNNQSIISKALFKGTLMALTNACIIWLILYIANMDKSVLMVVAVVVAAAFGYVTAYFEARAALNAQEAQARHARGGDVSSSSDGVDTSDSSREEDDEDDFVDPGPDPDAGDFDAEALATGKLAYGLVDLVIDKEHLRQLVAQELRVGVGVGFSDDIEY